MKGEESRILRGSSWTGENKNGRRKGEGSIGLANSKESQRHSKVFRLSQLLPTIYKRFHVYSQTIT